MSSTPTINSSRKKFGYVDALRGVAILAVIMVHTGQYGTNNLPAMLSKVSEQGGRGVQLFFLLSAFTLFLSMQNRIKSEIRPTKNFFIRRFFRIAPLYYLGIGYYLFQNGISYSPLNVISNFTFTHGFNPYWINNLVPGGWSIAVEMTVYAVLPFFFMRIKSPDQAVWLFIISILARLFLIVFFHRHPLVSRADLWQEFLFFYFPSQLPVFSLGIILFFLVSEKEGIKQFSGTPLLILSGLILVQLATGIDFFPAHLLYGAGFLVLAFSLAKFPSRVLVNPFFTNIGKISYSMYLVHFAVLYWLNRIHFIDYSTVGWQNYCLRFIIVVSLSSGISALLYNLVEVPFQKLGKKLIERSEMKASELRSLE